MTAPPASAPRCQMCTRPPSPHGPVMPVGPDNAYVDMGHLGEDYDYDNCSRRAQKQVQARGRAAVLARGRVS